MSDYQAKAAAITIYDKADDVPQTSREAKSLIPTEGTSEYNALQAKIADAFSSYPIDANIDYNDMVSWLRQQPNYSEYSPVAEDADFKKFVKTAIIPII